MKNIYLYFFLLVYPIIETVLLKKKKCTYVSLYKAIYSSVWMTNWKMQGQPAYKLIFWILVTFSSLFCQGNSSFFFFFLVNLPLREIPLQSSPSHVVVFIHTHTHVIYSRKYTSLLGRLIMAMWCCRVGGKVCC